MSVDVLNVVEIGQPVFDDAVMISRYQPLIAVGVLQGSNGRVVSLHDRFKVESGTIP
jgi:hypothetical protein